MYSLYLICPCIIICGSSRKIVIRRFVVSFVRSVVWCLSRCVYIDNQLPLITFWLLLYIVFCIDILITVLRSSSSWGSWC